MAGASAVAAVTPLVLLADAIDSDESRQLSLLYRWRHLLGNVDWSFALAWRRSSSTGEASWDQIGVLGDTPPRAGGHHGGSFPPEGINVWSARRSAGTAAVKAFLSGVLIANGYYDLGDAVERTVVAATPLGDRQEPRGA